MRTLLLSIAVQFLLAVAASGAGASASGAPAQEVARFPTKPINLIVTLPAGSVLDNVARLVAQQLTEDGGQPVVVLNRPGASSAIAMNALAQAPADGYTLLFGASNLVGQAATNTRFESAVRKELVPASEVVRGPLVIAVHPEMPVRSIQELVSYSKAHPGKLNFGSVGIGSSAHFVMEYFKARTGASLAHVPFAGAPATLQAALQGDVHVLAETPALVKSYVDSGKLRALAVTGDQRYAALPQVPSTTEAGLPDFDFGFWMGLFAPTGTPQAVVAKLNAAVVAILRKPEVNRRLVGMGYVPVGSTPQQFSDRVNREISRFARIAEDSKLRIQE